MFALCPQTPIPGPLCLRNPTLGYFAPKFCPPALRATGLGKFPSLLLLRVPFRFPPPRSSSATTWPGARGPGPGARGPRPRPARLGQSATAAHPRRGQSAAAMQPHPLAGETNPLPRPAPQQEPRARSSSARESTPSKFPLPPNPGVRAQPLLPLTQRSLTPSCLFPQNLWSPPPSYSSAGELKIPFP